MSGKMSGLFSSIARTFSDEVQVYKSSHPVRGRWVGAANPETTEAADQQPQQQLRPIRTAHSLPTNDNAEPPLRHSSSSISDSSETPVGSPTAVDAPVEAACGSPFTSRLKRGTHPYDYWYTIKNL